MYVASAVSGSVMIVAGLELTSTTLIALFPQRLACLGAGIVELAGLADNDGTGADEKDFLDISSFWHHIFFLSIL